MNNQSDSTPQREPCMDVSELKDACDHMGRMTTNQFGDADSAKKCFLVLKAARGLLTGRTEAKAEGDMVMAPREPTGQMIGAGGVALFKSELGRMEARDLVTCVYKAMVSEISAAPPREPTYGKNYQAGLWSRRNWEAILEDHDRARTGMSGGE